MIVARISILCVTTAALVAVSCARPVGRTYEQSYWAASTTGRFESISRKPTVCSTASTTGTPFYMRR